MAHKRSINVFSRVPELGRVKTRLQSELGQADTLALHKALLAHTLTQALQCVADEYRLWLAGDMSLAAATHLREQWPQYTLLPQVGDTLGDRMLFALQSTLQTSDSCVIIGSDCPGIDGPYLSSAFAQLAAGSDLVLGPASDGGYVLIGASTAPASVFSGVEWGSSKVLGQTLERAAQAQLQHSVLNVLSDVDVPADLPVARRYGLLKDALS